MRWMLRVPGRRQAPVPSSRRRVPAWAPVWASLRGGCRGGRAAAVRHDAVEALRLLDPAGDRRLGRDPADPVRSRRIDLLERRRQVGRVPMGQLGRRVDAGGLEEVRVLGPDPVDPHQVGVVDPLQDQPARDPRGGLDAGAPLRRRAPLQERLGGVDAGFGQLLSVLGPDALDLGDVHPRPPDASDGRGHRPNPASRVYCGPCPSPRRPRRVSRARERAAAARRGGRAARQRARMSGSRGPRRTTGRPPCRSRRRRRAPR